ncbi:MAG: DEAD/DEAH box helicase [Acholeplasmatales bacterium]|jgi:ATP-dependent RNA helicase RhlE|nr:DEAD/DEAH box helicase [Acholeplasmatales bacterium]
MDFKKFNLDTRILRSLDEQKYEVPTSIQNECIPLILEGKDVLGCAQTGSGKTCAFSVPIIEHILNKKTANNISALIIAPTRELAIQIASNTYAYSKYVNVKTCVIYGGVSEVKQIEALKRKVDILIATPGRLLDFLDRGIVNLEDLDILVLDEADRMLDMGFIVDIKKIMKYIKKIRQTLMFSATMPKEIEDLAASFLTNPTRIDVSPNNATVDTVTQDVYYVDKENKTKLLIQLIKNTNITSALVFSRTKHGADKINKNLQEAKITSSAIHGNKSQIARQKALQDFKDYKIQVLVATDIAARGIDIDSLSHVINYDLPDTPENYVHRIGRTARAGKNGTAITFCSIDELDMLKEIEKLLNTKINVVENEKYPMQVFYKSDKPQNVRYERKNLPKNTHSKKI